MDRNTYRRVLDTFLVVVALRKESVDRNYIIKITGTAPRRSLSARRAWIEIRRALGFVDPDKVALRKESVDRNTLQAGHQ